jgi:uncharacterized membrane protein
MTYLILKWLHVLSATVLFGTGAGIAFFMWRAHRTRKAEVIAAVAGDVVLADALFTASAVLIQPATGILLMHTLGYPYTLLWVKASIVLYALSGLCWLPVVWLQLRMRELARGAARSGAPLPEMYYRYFRYWFWLGWPAFASVLAILWLMTAKPA